MSNILCIGASGFVGTRFIATANDSFVLSNLDKQQSPFFPELTVLGDVRNHRSLNWV
jgi:hypothetical protein